MVVRSTTTNFKPLTISVLGYALYNVAKVSFSWLCKMSACCLHNFISKLYTYRILQQFADWRSACICKVAKHAENHALQALQFKMNSICSKFPDRVNIIQTANESFKEG